MLHEILLSLSGHPSALEDLPLSPSESALLSSLQLLAQRHRELRAHLVLVASHSSTICRAVAAAITSSHLARFQKKILEVESRILRKDARSVGAYNIVPLAAVVAEFEEWTRLMDWLWGVACFMLPPGKSTTQCSGAAIMDKLRIEAQTGYPELEEAALELSKVAESSWLRQLSSWILYGRLPAFGGDDFFIQEGLSDDAEEAFRAESKLLPKFVTSETAASILFIGKSLNLIKNRGLQSSSNGSGLRGTLNPELDLLSVHLRHLSILQYPLSSSSLSNAISDIRLSLSSNTLQQLLPLPKIMEMLSLLQDFLLLGRGEFAVSLIGEADERIRSRNRRPGHTSSRKDPVGLNGLLVKEGEVNAILSRTWGSLATLLDDGDLVDETMDLARDIVQLSIAKSSTTRPATPGRAKGAKHSLPQISNVIFNDFLVPVPTTLSVAVPSPLDLFLSSSEMSIYSSIHSYLLAIRRAHIHTSDMWRQSTLRRDHPAPLGPPQSTSPRGQALLKHRRQRAYNRRIEMRKVWATCSAAVFFLSETGEFLEGQVVKESWAHLQNWIIGKDTASRPSTASHVSSPTSLRASIRGNNNEATVATAPRLQRDPEALASAHRRYLTALVHQLLFTDISFTSHLRTFLRHADELVAYLVRLQDIQISLDLEEDEGVEDALATHAEDEKEVKKELDRSRKRLDGDMKALVARLRELDERTEESQMPSAVNEGDFEPWRGVGVDRLLMKLEFGGYVD
ncbi:hypothetical protein K402DRAFT_410176 [Aulographum hederae CBS 113979]|uniref:Spindle pole body component n=1 Tax=Aulographum hederae CBS 113979 TaxID=1176131 RepID=A0A6G1HCI6_9PEZI|nr:hypothetical protein K402DRAFT_410176 [Aulographum hederae CBS 113979]